MDKEEDKHHNIKQSLLFSIVFSGLTTGVMLWFILLTGTELNMNRIIGLIIFSIGMFGVGMITMIIIYLGAWREANKTVKKNFMIK